VELVGRLYRAPSILHYFLSIGLYGFYGPRTLTKGEVLEGFPGIGWLFFYWRKIGEFWNGSFTTRIFSSQFKPNLKGRNLPFRGFPKGKVFPQDSLGFTWVLGFWDKGFGWNWVGGPLAGGTFGKTPRGNPTSGGLFGGAELASLHPRALEA